jgi:hypothetical protein
MCHVLIVNRTCGLCYSFQSVLLFRYYYLLFHFFPLLEISIEELGAKDCLGNRQGPTQES